MAIVARPVRHARRLALQMAEVAVPAGVFAEVLKRIDRLRPTTAGEPHAPLGLRRALV